MSVENLTSTNFDTADFIATLPKYCQHFKFLLIEELLLEDCRQLHYGKCRVIGKIAREAGGKVFLENTRITDLPKEYSLPEGTLKLRLLTSNTKNTFYNNCTVEVLGEVCLINVQETQTNLTHLTSRGVVEQLQSANTREYKEKLLYHFRNHYTPAVNVWFINPVDRAGEVMSLNLEIRTLEQKDYPF